MVISAESFFVFLEFTTGKLMLSQRWKAYLIIFEKFQKMKVTFAFSELWWGTRKEDIKFEGPRALEGILFLKILGEEYLTIEKISKNREMVA